MKNNILTGLIVIGFLVTVGADAYLVFSQVFGPIVPVLSSIIITIALTLFVSHLLSKIQFDDKTNISVSNELPDNFDVEGADFKKKNHRNKKEENRTITL